MSASLVYAYIALVALMTSGILLLLPEPFKTNNVYKSLALLFSLVLLLIPVADVPIFYYLRGYIGDLSITSTIVFSATIIQKGREKLIYPPAEIKFLVLIIIIAGLFLYPLALGLGQFDPYRLGYQPHILLLILFPVALYCWSKQFYFIVFTLTSACLSFTIGLLESNNLWDYLLDPILMLVFLGVGLWQGLTAFFMRISK